MLNPKFALGLSVICLLTVGKHFSHQQPGDRQKMAFTDSAESVQDSMLLLRQICASIEPIKFTNCIVHDYDSTLVLNRKNLGKLDSMSTANTGFVGMNKGNARHILSIMKFLRRNRISGTYHDVGLGFWFYSYKDDPNYSRYTQTRQIYIWYVPADTLSPVFQYYTKILDRKKRMVLVGLNDVPYRKF